MVQSCLPNHSRKDGNKLLVQLPLEIRKNTMDTLLQRKHNLSSKRWIKLNLKKKLDMAQIYILESPPSRNSRTKPFPLYLVILELYPISSRAQFKEKAVWRRSSSHSFSRSFVLAGHIVQPQHRTNMCWQVT